MKAKLSKLLVLFLLIGSTTSVVAEQLNPKYPGILVIESALDSSVVDRVVAGDMTYLIWSDGLLEFATKVTTSTVGENDFTIPYGTDLIGMASGNKLLFTSGNYNFDETIILKSPEFTFSASQGVLEIADGRITAKIVNTSKSSNSNLVLLAGMILFIAILMSRSRRQMRSKS